MSVLGIDSRSFVRNTVKRDGTPGHFESVIGIAVKVRDYISFDVNYKKAMKHAFSTVGMEINYQYYCTNDLCDVGQKYDILNAFVKEIAPHIEKVHVFYTLFSKKRLQNVKVYGRLAKREKIKLATPERTYEDLISQHLIQCFPVICAWRLMEYLSPKSADFHLDSYGGHICEAQEGLEESEFKRFVYPHGDCSNPVISTADLLIDLLDKNLETQGKLLVFDNIRPALPEFGDNLLVYPILNKHLPKITPIDKKPVDTMSTIKHPVFWVFKGEQLIDSGTMKRSEMYRNFLDYVAGHHGTVKMFEKGKDIDYVQKGDFGAYINTNGKEIIDSYRKLGVNFEPFKLDHMVPNKNK